MSETPGSTLGFERRFNRFLKIDDAGEFVRELTADPAPQPPNFKRIVELNRGPLLTEAAQLDPIAPARLQELLKNGLVREVLAGSSYLSSEDPRVHLGLGDATKVSELIVSYPDGSEARLTDIASNQVVDVKPEPR